MSALVKICGITRAEDAHEAVRLGAFAVGFVFHATSPRCIAPDAVRVIADALPKSVLKVGVFVDQPAAVVRSVFEHAGIDIAQLHGDEDPDLCTASAPRVWKALRVSQASDAERTRLVEHAEAYRACEALLVDALSTKAHGGTGERSDWAVAAALAKTHRVILAGGLGPDNVAEAINAVHPYAVDVSSGVEDAPGRKNFEKMAALFNRENHCKVTSRPVSVS